MRFAILMIVVLLGTVEGSPKKDHDPNQSGALNTDTQSQTTNQEEKKSVNEYQKSHWSSETNPKDNKYNGEEETTPDSKKKKVANKVGRMVRRQVLKKASSYAGEKVVDNYKDPLVKKVGVMMRDAAIRRVSHVVFSKTLHGGVNVLKTKLDTVNSVDGTKSSRDVDLHNERAVARDLGFRMMTKLADTVSLLAGGSLAEGTIRTLHKNKVKAKREGRLLEMAARLKQEEQQQ